MFFFACPTFYINFRLLPLPPALSGVRGWPQREIGREKGGYGHQCGEIQAKHHCQRWVEEKEKDVFFSNG